jgi:UDP-3-O-[3-hydroxymyristoyl] glucosamine N-acyltransferase
VNTSIRKPGWYSSAIPVDEAARFRKNAARFHRLDEFVREVRRERGAGADEAAPESDDSSGE